MKVAVVGTNGLAQYIANALATETSHQFVVLSRRVDYSNPSDLRFKLAGSDIVISTLSGPSQLALIDAAAAAHVRRFVPSEFGGPPCLRPPDDPLDQDRRQALVRLHQLEATGMRFTIFTCGVLYERFAPGGMAASQIGLHSNVAQEGDYLMDLRNAQAHLPYPNPAGQPATICLTAARDVGRFIAAAVGLPSWPREFRLRGNRLNVQEVVAVAEALLGRPFETTIHTRTSLQDALIYARAVGDRRRETRVHHLMHTAEGRYDFLHTNLNQLIPIQPEGFREWLMRVWALGDRSRH